MTYPISITVNVGDRVFVLTLEEAEKLRDTLNQILPEKQNSSTTQTYSDHSLLHYPPGVRNC